MSTVPPSAIRRSEAVAWLHPNGETTLTNAQYWRLGESFRAECEWDKATPLYAADVSHAPASAKEPLLMQVAHIVMGFENEDSAGHYNMLRDIRDLIAEAPSHVEPPQDWTDIFTQAEAEGRTNAWIYQQIVAHNARADAKRANVKEWITCPATGKQCNDFCDPGKGDICASSGLEITPRANERYKYAERNPLGGPAAIFEAMAERIRAGEDYHAVLADYGLNVAPQVVQEPGSREAGAREPAGAAPSSTASPDLEQRLDAIAKALGYPAESWRMAGCDVLAHAVTDTITNANRFLAELQKIDALLDDLRAPVNGDWEGVSTKLSRRGRIRAIVGTPSASERSVELDEGYIYWTHEGYVMRRSDEDRSTDLLGPGGWTPAV